MAMLGWTRVLESLKVAQMDASRRILALRMHSGQTLTDRTPPAFRLRGVTSPTWWVRGVLVDPRRRKEVCSSSYSSRRPGLSPLRAPSCGTDVLAVPKPRATLKTDHVYSLQREALA